MGVRLAACGHGSSRLSAISEMQRHVQQHRKDRRQTQHPQIKGPDNLTSQLLPIITGEMPDPYPAASVLCEPAQSRCTWTCHKKHLARKFTGKMPDPYPAASVLCEPAQSKCTWTCCKRHFVRKFVGKMPDPHPAASTLCEPAQSKCTWTCHKRHLARKFVGKMPNAPDTTLIEHRALTVTVRSLQCGHAVWGKNEIVYAWSGGCFATIQLQVQQGL